MGTIERKTARDGYENVTTGPPVAEPLAERGELKSEADAFLSAADAAIDRGLREDSEEYLVASEQLSGQ